jgi:hypothetical protein
MSEKRTDCLTANNFSKDTGKPYINVDIGKDNVLTVGEVGSVTLQFSGALPNASYTYRVLAGAESR